MRLSAVVVLGVASASLFGLVGCSAQQKPDAGLTSEAIKAIGADLKSKGFHEQAAALSDGRVDSTEYKGALENLTNCVSKFGASVIGLSTSPVDGISLEFGVDPGPGASSTVNSKIAQCRARYWDNVSAVYQDTTPIRMDEPLRQFAIQCMDKKGYKLTGSEKTPLEMAGSEPLKDSKPSKQWQTAQQCLIDGLGKLFPDEQFASIPFR